MSVSPPVDQNVLEAALAFDNRFTRELPADPLATNSRRQVHGACFSRVRPARVAAPRLVAYAAEVAELIGLPAGLRPASNAALDCAEAQALAAVFSGNQMLPGMDPHACCYGGHQFGNWAGQLGDGRAINLGEVVGPDGRHQMLQLKGAGPTPYSRTADGLAVLRSSVREFLCSEAMHHLGVPTTRALSLVVTGESVVRDMFYDGNARPEPGAVVCRVAPSFARFGSFEIFAARRDNELLRRFLDHTIRADFPALGAPSPDTYVAWFTEVARRTAALMVHWMRVGFVHGVMNTDNMSVLGLTIDYGPYGWLEDYDPDWTPNTTDAGGRRYRFGQQPQVALWNLAQLGNAIYPLVEAVEPLQAAISTYSDAFDAGRKSMMAEKFGLEAYDPQTDDGLIDGVHEALQLAETDMTLFYRALAELPVESVDVHDTQALLGPISGAYYSPETLDDAQRAGMCDWLAAYVARVRRDATPDARRRQRMHAVNPKYVLRNYLAQLAIDQAEAGDYSMIAELLEVLRRPYEDQPGMARYAEKRPDWARHRAGCSMLSCSS